MIKHNSPSSPSKSICLCLFGHLSLLKKKIIHSQYRPKKLNMNESKGKKHTKLGKPKNNFTNFSKVYRHPYQKP